MPRSRSRSRRGDRERRPGDRRSRSKDKAKGKTEDRSVATKAVEEVKKLAGESSSEHDIVSVAIKQLPADIRERLMKLFEEGLLKDNDLDLRSITVFASLNEGLQARVMTYLENERIYVANARSKSGFLIATCDKAKTGCLDARGLGAIDPWRQALFAMSTPKLKIFDLENERDWIDKQGSDPIKLRVNTAMCHDEIDASEVTVEVPLSETSAAVKAKLVAMGIKSIRPNAMRLWVDPIGFLKDRHSLAHYNLVEDCELVLSVCSRGGRRTRRDHAVGVKRPKTHEKITGDNPQEARDKKKGDLEKAASVPMPQPGKPLSPKSFAAAVAAMKAGGAPPSIPGFPGLPAVPGLPALPPAALAGTGPGAGLAGLPGFPGLGGLPALPGMPKLGLPGMPGTGPSGGLLGLTGPGAGLAGLPKLPGLAGISKIGSLPPANGLPGMPKLPGLGMPGMPQAGASSAMAALGSALGAGLPKLGMSDGKIPGLPDLSTLGKAGNGLLSNPILSKMSLDGMSPPSMSGSTAKAGAASPGMDGAIAKGGVPDASPVGATAKAGGSP